MSEEIESPLKPEALEPKQSIFDSAFEAMPELVQNPYAQGGKVRFNTDIAGNTKERFLTYGSDIYGTRGFDPNRDNNALYNSTTSDWVDVSRAWDGMWKLAGVGFTDSFGFGIAGDSDNHKAFGSIMNDYSSTRDNSAGFISNALLSAGYTVGILGAIATEELLLTLGTFATGGFGAPATAVAGTASATRGFKLLRDAWKVADKVGDHINFFQKYRNIENSRTLFTQAGASITRGIGNIGKELRPLGNFGDFVRSLDKADGVADLSRLSKSYMGAAALTRDARKFYLAHSESRLEANFVYDEIYEGYLKQWQLENPGERIPEDIRLDIEDRAKEGYGKAYSANLGLIYATNGLLFGSLFKGYNPLLETVGKAGLEITTKRGTVQSVKALAKSPSEYFGQMWRNYKPWSKKNLYTFPSRVLNMSTEGFQEVGQDIISKAATRYAGFNMDDNGVISLDSNWKDKQSNDWESFGYLSGYGDYFSNLYDSKNDSSWHSFFTGMLIGPMVGPVNITNQVFGDLVGGKITPMSKASVAEETTAYEKRKKLAKELTVFFENSGEFIKHIDSQSNMRMGANSWGKMIKAAEAGDKKYFEDNRGEVFRTSIEKMVELGMEEEFIDHLESLSKFTVDELNQFAETDTITEENKGEFLEKAKFQIERVKNYKQAYEKARKDNVNPHAFKRRDGKTKDGKINTHNFYAHENYVRELVWNKDKMFELKTRIGEVVKTLAEDNLMTEESLNPLLTSEATKSTIKSLQIKIEANKEYDLNPEETKAMELELEALQEYAVAYEKLNSITEESTETLSDAKVGLKNAFKNYAVSKSKSELFGNIDTAYTKAELAESKFNSFFDLIQLKNELDYFGNHASVLGNTEFKSQFLKQQIEAYELLEKNMTSHIEKSVEASQAKKASNDMLNELLAEDLVFDLRELDDVFEKGLMPETVYNHKTGEVASDEEYNKALGIVNKHFSKVSGKSIRGHRQALSTTQLARKRNQKDNRTTKGLTRQYSVGNKLDKVFTVKSLIKKLLKNGNKSLSAADVELLSKLEELGVDGKVMLTENGVRPIDVNDEGVLVIDVRFASADYSRPKTSEEINDILDSFVEEYKKKNPDDKFTDEEIKEHYRESLNLTGVVDFEYLAMSGILTQAYTEKLEENPKFKSKVQAIMDTTLAAAAEQQAQEGQDIELVKMQIALSNPEFLDPASFLREALTNHAFQMMLQEVPFTTSENEESSMWLSFNTALAEAFGEKHNLRGSILDNVLYLAQVPLAADIIFQESIAEDVEEVENVSTQSKKEEEEEVVEEDTPADVSADDVRKELTKSINTLTLEKENAKKELNNLHALKFLGKRKLSDKIKSLDAQITELKSKLNELFKPSTETSAAPEAVEVSTPVTAVTETGGLVLNGDTLLEDMPKELQYELFRNYMMKAIPSKYEALLKSFPEYSELAYNNMRNELEKDGSLSKIQGLLAKASYSEIINKHISNNEEVPPAGVEKETEVAEEEEEVEGSEEDVEEVVEVEEAFEEFTLAKTNVETVKVNFPLLNNDLVSAEITDEVIQEFVTDFNNASTQERLDLIYAFEEQILSTYNSIKTEGVAPVEEVENTTEGLTKASQSIGLAGQLVPAYQENRKNLKDGEVLNVQIDLAGSEGLLFETKDGGYLYSINVLNKDGFKVGSIKYQSKEAVSILESSNRDNAKFKITSLVVQNNGVVSLTGEVYVDGVRTKEMLEQTILDLEAQISELEMQDSATKESNPYLYIADTLPKITPESAADETGVKTGTGKDINIGLLSKNGDTVQEAAEVIGESLRNELYSNLTDEEVRQEIIDLLQLGKEKYKSRILNTEEIQQLKIELGVLKQDKAKYKSFSENRLDELLSEYNWLWKLEPVDLFSQEGVNKQSVIEALVKELGDAGMKIYNAHLKKAAKDAGVKLRTFKASHGFITSTVKKDTSFEEELKKQSITERESAASKLYNQTLEGKKSHVQIASLLSIVNSSPNATMSERMAVLDAFNLLTTSQEQVKLFMSKFEKVFNEALQREQNTNLPGTTVRLKNDKTVYTVLKSEEGTAVNEIILHDGVTTMSVSFETFFSAFEKQLEPGTFTESGKPSVAVDVDGSIEISTSYKEIFSNFNESMKKQSELSNEDLASAIIEEINKCK